MKREFISSIGKECFYCQSAFEEKTSWSHFFGVKAYSLLCSACRDSFKEIKEIYCEVCGRAYPGIDSDTGSLRNAFVASPSVRCKECLEWREKKGYDLQQRSIYEYNPFMQELLAQFKYRGDEALSTLLTTSIERLTKRSGLYDLVTVIPVSHERLWERGFNQSERLAEKLPLTKLLERRGDSKSGKQSKRTRAERMKELENAFVLSAEKNLIKGKKIVIVDDIYTTGATLHAAAEVFIRNGALEVKAVTAARAGNELKSDINVLEK